MTDRSNIANHQDLARAVGLIGEYEREIAGLRSAFEAKVARLQATIIAKADALHEAKVDVERAVEHYVLTHQETFEGSVARFSTGEVQLSWAPPAHVFTDSEAETVRRLRDKGFEHFIRLRETVNRRAIAEAGLSERELKAIRMERRQRQVVHIRPSAAALVSQMPRPAA
jgi:phage host-nuclease inhibitor protein Gam